MRVYIGNLPPRIDEATLYELIRLIAPVEKIHIVRIKTTPPKPPHAFAEFRSAADGEYMLAFAEKQPLTLYGSRLRFGRAGGAQQQQQQQQQKDTAPPSRSGFGLFVSNLDPDLLTEEAVRFPFARFGTVLAVRVARNEIDGAARGHAVVRFVERDAAERAKRELDGQILLNRPCRIEYERVGNERF